MPTHLFIPMKRALFSLLILASFGTPWPGALAFVSASFTRLTVMVQSHSPEVCPSCAELRSHPDPISEIIDALFPPRNQDGLCGMEKTAAPSFSQRLGAGRAAQGFLTTDGLEARTIVPPQELTYGEFNLGFFMSLVDECLRIRAGYGSEHSAMEYEASNLVFGDMGSGCGRLVVAQALAWPWGSCRGVEKVQSLHDMAEATLIRATHMTKDRNTLSTKARRLLRNMAPCTLSLGDVNNEVDISDVDVLFCYTSSFPAFGDQLTEFSYTLGHKLRPGAQVITTDRRLVSDGPWEFVLLGEREGPNSETGGKSTAFLWQVVKSAL